MGLFPRERESFTGNDRRGFRGFIALGRVRAGLRGLHSLPQALVGWF